MFKKILIANRGEIALRVIRAARELGIETVAVYSQADASSLHVQLADEAYCIGPARSANSYLNIPSIVSTALLSRVDAIHPGYGFLAENSNFAEMCESHGLKFIGPTSKNISSMGDKATAKSIMMDLGVPVIPGIDGLIDNKEQAIQSAKKLGYPVILKATAGGGGRGMRIAQDEDQLTSGLDSASQEANNAFGNPGIYLEKYITKIRHIEIQILADEHGNVIHLGERDCTVQRRHQKLLEETPGMHIDKRLRKKMGNAAVLAAKKIKYRNAGTVEFILDMNTKNFYFMEMNTRIQVEHPVTEMVTSIDLIKSQIRIAAGEKLWLKQNDVKITGHSMEFRINAEDPDKNFAPSPGKIDGYIPPGGPGVRVDSHCYTGYEIPPYYDSMIAKLIVHDDNREAAISRAKRALDEFAITGIQTTIPFHLKVLEHPKFISGDYATDFVAKDM
ncbi:MAG: acetyl-CoA carboxylase biotin carboxylase subunit [Candidatus Melainabacteria bacterium RIFCSPHIGHO2_02_FULL_34_12]|nr:MAG: acetyl-CoA carboxylase biotin carboxylase subunit [Candidatus Melainabacteria bacterium RIFCSPHIGHO2_02_FULL_34_12]